MAANIRYQNCVTRSPGVVETCASNFIKSKEGSFDEGEAEVTDGFSDQAGRVNFCPIRYGL